MHLAVSLFVEKSESIVYDLSFEIVKCIKLSVYATKVTSVVPFIIFSLTRKALNEPW